MPLCRYRTDIGPFIIAVLAPNVTALVLHRRLKRVRAIKTKLVLAIRVVDNLLGVDLGTPLRQVLKNNASFRLCI